MGSLFDDSNDADQTDQPLQDGILPTDLIGLAPSQISIVRLILGRREMSYTQICDAVEALPDHPSRTELDKTLKTLLEQHWLIRDESAVYRVNLRRKSAGPLNTMMSRRRSGHKAIQDLWDALNFDSDQAPPAGTPDDNKPHKS